jgi:hypothetical protein
MYKSEQDDSGSEGSMYNFLLFKVIFVFSCSPFNFSLNNICQVSVLQMIGSGSMVNLDGIIVAIVRYGSLLPNKWADCLSSNVCWAVAGGCGVKSPNSTVQG